MGFLFGSGKAQAAAIKDSSELEAKQARENARSAQIATETLIAQDRAGKAAAAILTKPQGEVNVELASTDNGDTFDAATGKRRTRRSTYSAATPTSIQI